MLGAEPEIFPSSGQWDNETVAKTENKRMNLNYF